MLLSSLRTLVIVSNLSFHSSKAKRSSTISLLCAGQLKFKSENRVGLELTPAIVRGLFLILSHGRSEVHCCYHFHGAVHYDGSGQTWGCLHLEENEETYEDRQGTGKENCRHGAVST